MKNSSSRPNIVYIDCHDLGELLGCYGHPYLETPHLDAFAANGARFTQHIATAPICMPSRASIYSGLMPHSTGVVGQEPLAPDAKCLPARLRSIGYSTVLCGSLKILNQPRRVGFDQQLKVADNEKPDAAAQFIKSQHSEDMPFFLSISMQQCHRPFGDLYDSNVLERISVPPYLPDIPDVRRDLGTLAWQIKDLDRQVGKVLTAVEDSGISEKTLVIFTTEHGPAVARAKHTTYDSGLRTALLMHWKGVIPAGKKINQLTSNVDVLPTILELCDANVPKNLHGASCAHLVRSQAHENCKIREYAYSEFNWGRRSGCWYYTPTRAVRNTRFKLIRSYRAIPIYVDNGWLSRFPEKSSLVEQWYGTPLPPTQLFDLTKDPFELNNLAGTSELAITESNLLLHLDNHLKRTADPILAGPVFNSFGEPDVMQWVEQPSGSFILADNDPLDPKEKPLT